MLERTLIILKPDCVGRRLIGEVISRFEGKGLRVVGCKMLCLHEETAEKHYAEHLGKQFYSRLIDFITSGPVVVLVLRGPSAVAQVRVMVGATFCSQSPPGTIRGDLGVVDHYNLIHASDSVEAAEREISIHFLPGEVQSAPPREDIRWTAGDDYSG